MKSSDTITLDRLDRKILNELQLDAGRSNKDLAEAVGTSPPSCLRRVRRLRKAGLIAKQIALLDPTVAGASVVAVTTIQLRSHNVKERDDLVRLIQSMPEVTQCYMLTGGEDMLVLSNLATLQQFEDVIAQRLSDCAVVDKLSTTIAYRTLKFAPLIRFDDESWETLEPHAAKR